MAERHDRGADAEPPAAHAWKGPFANGAVLAVVATTMLWGAFREFRPPPEEPKSLEQVFDEANETVRRAREFTALSRERSLITDALDERIETLEAQRAADPDHAGLDDEVRRLRKTLLAEMETTNRLLGEINAAREEKKRQEDDKRREQVARAAWEWQRGRWRLMAMAAAAWALAGWFFVQASILRHRQLVASAGAETGARPQAEGRAVADPARVEEGDPQRGQKVFFYVFRVAVCVGVILFGLLGPEPHADAKDEREGLVGIGLIGLAFSTIWLFFGSIDWSTWNAIKGRVSGKRPDGDEAEAQADEPFAPPAVREHRRWEG